ncbi:IP6K2 kinase, partial [Atractosteus spatula]|nr:IP6K2 kinase [Atractosteus spatula]
MSPALEAMQAEQQGFSAKGVLLEPFVHQVGGHSCVLRFSEQTICKPLIPREHQFYKSLPAELRRFTPQYKGRGERESEVRRGEGASSHGTGGFKPRQASPLEGRAQLCTAALASSGHRGHCSAQVCTPVTVSWGVVSVSFEGDEEGNLCLIAYPLHSDAGELEKNVDPSADCEPKNKMVKWGNKKQGLLLDNENYSKERARQLRKEEKLKSHREEECEWANQSEVLRYSLEKGNVKAQFKHNPWSMKCHQQQLQRMKENAKHRNQYKFILLENLTWRYAMPCVLDLKMGTRQHGDDATEEKKANQIRKCQQSTSAIIGVRVCGMQVYQSDSGQLMFMNKYHGRKLTVQGFKEALFQFFHDGRRLRRELLLPVLRRLRELEAVLEARTVVHEGQDTGYIFGLQNLIAIIKELEDDSGD